MGDREAAIHRVVHDDVTGTPREALARVGLVAAHRLHREVMQLEILPEAGLAGCLADRRCQGSGHLGRLRPLSRGRGTPCPNMGGGDLSKPTPNILCGPPPPL